MRLDRFLRDARPDLTNAERARALRDGRVAVDGRSVWLASWKVDPISAVTLDGVELVPAIDPLLEPTQVLLHENDLLAIDKPTGVLPEPKGPNDRGDLTSMVRASLGAEWVAAHRLDRDTSGVMVFTRPGDIRRQVVEAFASRETTKLYRAVVSDPLALDDQGTVSVRIDNDLIHRDRMRAVLPGERGGQNATTHYRVIDRASGIVELRPLTGRTHQLRVHLAHLDCPILGDRLYGELGSAPRLMLHAHRLEVLGRIIVAPLPDGFGQLSAD